MAAAVHDTEYEDDFEQEENGYDDEFFESEGELEVPPTSSTQQQQDQQQDEPARDGSMWPSLSAAASSKGRAPAGLFGRSLFAVDAGAAAMHASSSNAKSAAAVVTLQPPRTELQRRQAATALRRSLQLQQQQGPTAAARLQLSKQVDLLTLHPLSLYQQHCQGVGVYAGRTAAACQTRQLDSDVHEQEGQTDQIEQQPGSCQVPDDLYSCSSLTGARSSAQHHHQQQAAAAADPALEEFLGWAVPQILFELRRAEAEVAAENSLACAAARPSFCPVHTAASLSSGSSSGVDGGGGALLAGELQLAACGSLLEGRPVVGLAAPPTAQAAAAAAAAIAASAAGTGADAAAVSSHLLLACYAPVTMSAGAAASEHGLAGLGCLCVWDLMQASRSPVTQQQQAAAGGSSSSSSSCCARLPSACTQLLVSEGRPTCCCWGPGEAACLVFAGMEEGGVCCWDLSEPGKAHRATAARRAADTKQAAQQQQHQQPPKQHGVQRVPVESAAGLTTMRRPSYSTEVPWFVASGSSGSGGSDGQLGVFGTGGLLCEGQLAGAACGAIAALAAVPSSSGSGSSSSGRAGVASSGGGSVCRLIALTAGGCVSIYSVMLGDAGCDVAVTDLGMRTGSRVWLVKVCEGLSLGGDVLKPPHLKRATQQAAAAVSQAAQGVPGSSSSNPHSQLLQSARCLMVLPGPTQQLLVGTDGGKVLKGSALGATSPPHAYISAQWWPGQDDASEAAAAAAADTCAVPDCSSANGGSSSRSRSCWREGLLGAVTSLSVCPMLPEAWAAGHSCGRVAVFALGRSRPCWVWQHPSHAPVVAVRWLPQSAVLLALFGVTASSSSSTDGSCGLLLAFRPGAAAAAKQPQAAAAEALYSRHTSAQSLPVCMEVLSMSAATSTALTSCPQPAAAPEQPGNGSNRGRTAARPANRVCVAVGFDDGSSSVYQLSSGALWAHKGAGAQQELQAALQELLSCG